MKKTSRNIIAQAIAKHRNEKGLSQAKLAEMTGVSRNAISRIEKMESMPSIEQLEILSEVLDINITDLFVEQDTQIEADNNKKYNIAVAGTGYVGLSLAILLAQHNHVTAVDIIPEKIEMLNKHISPIKDEYIERYLTEKKLDLNATLDAKEAYKNADFVIIAAPTNYDSKMNHFDCSAVESVIELVLKVNPDAMMVIKSTIPVGYTETVRRKYNTTNIIFSPEFC